MYVGKWTIPKLVGQRPPPCGGVTFSMIDPHRALLFGGRQETGRVGSVYIFDFRELVRPFDITGFSPVLGNAVSLWGQVACLLYTMDLRGGPVMMMTVYTSLRLTPITVLCVCVGNSNS